MPTPADSPGSEPPLFAGTILGVRCWKTNRHCESLGAIVMPGGWRIDGETRAYCAVSLGGSHKAPDAKCSCGLYAYHPWHGAFPDLTYCHEGDYTLAGVIEAWGKIELHEEGFRAQFARPVAFALPMAGWSGYREAFRRLAGKSGAALIDPKKGESIERWVAVRNAAIDRSLVEELLPDREPLPEPPPAPPPYVPPRRMTGAPVPAARAAAAEPDEIGWGEFFKDLSALALEGLGQLIAGIFYFAVVGFAVIAVLAFLTNLVDGTPSPPDPSATGEYRSLEGFDSERLDRSIERAMRRIGHKDFKMP